VLTLLGYRGEAKKLLMEVYAERPEIYTAPGFAGADLDPRKAGGSAGGRSAEAGALKPGDEGRARAAFRSFGRAAGVAGQGIREAPKPLGHRKHAICRERITGDGRTAAIEGNAIDFLVRVKGTVNEAMRCYVVSTDVNT